MSKYFIARVPFLLQPRSFPHFHRCSFLQLVRPGSGLGVHISASAVHSDLLYITLFYMTSSLVMIPSKDHIFLVKSFY